MRTHILPETFEFLQDIDKNNNKAWFEKHKARYQAAHGNMIEFADELLLMMNKHDNIETPTGKKSLLRFYRDVRFSKDKRPYKNNMSGGFRRATALLRGSYYFHIQPGASFLGGGFWRPNPDDLKRIRTDIQADPSELRKILNHKTFKDYFGQMQGEAVKTAPKGFSKDDPAIDLIRHKGFILRHNFSDEEVLSKDFAKKLNEGFKKMRPFFDYMSEVLTTDANGVLIV